MKIFEKTGFWVVKCYHCGSHLIPRDRGWTFNGNYEKPTIAPSVNEVVNWPTSEFYREEAPSSRCHFTITDGNITYHHDCTHELVGMTLELPYC